MARIAHRQTGLRPGTRYYAYVRGKNTSGRSAWSSVLATTTPGTAPTSPPGAVADFRATGVSFDAIDFDWTPTAEASGYDLYITTSPTAPNPGTSPTAQVGAVGTYLATAGGLRGGVIYHTYIRATNAAGAGPWSIGLLVRTLRELPAVPTGFTNTSGTNDSLTYEWNTAARATGYDIYLSRSISPPDDTTQPTASVGQVTTYTATGLLGSSTYYAYIRGTSSVGTSAWSAAVATQTGLQAPTVPGNLSVTAPTYSTVRAQWSAAERATGYHLYITTNAVAPTAQTTPTVTLGNVTSYTRSGLSGGTAYRVYVRASNRAGNSAWATAATVTTPAAPVRAPAVPTNLMNTAQTESTLVYTWTASPGAAAYDLYISESNVAPTPQTAVTISVGGVTTYTFTGLDSATTFYVYIRAKSISADSAWSSAVSAATTTSSVTTSVPDIPADFTDESQTQTTINYSWTASTGATGYDLFIGTSSAKPASAATPTASIGATTTSTTELWEQSVNVTILNMLFIQNTLPQDVPETGTGRLLVDGTEVGTFDWSELRAKDRFNSGRGATFRESRALSFTSGGVTHYLALPAFNRFAYGRSSGTGTYRVEVEQEVEQAVTTYQATGLVSGVTYYAFIKAKNVNGSSGWSAAVAATTLRQPPAAVTGFAGPATPGDTSIEYSWSAAERATGYDLYFSTTNTAPTSGTVPSVSVAAVTSYTRTGLMPLTTYYAWIRARNTGGSSAWSSAVSVTTDRGAPAIPGVSISSVTQNSMVITWNAVAGAEYYKVHISTSGSTPHLVASGTTVRGTTTYTRTGLTAGTTYYVWVRSGNTIRPADGGIGIQNESAWSGRASATTIDIAPPAPTNLSILLDSETHNSITYSWWQTPRAVSYDLYASTSSTAPTGSTVPTATDITQTIYKRTGLSANTTYYAWVRAKNSGGNGACSSVISGKTLTAPPSVPAVPTGLGSSSATSRRIVYTWTAAARATGYELYISTTNTAPAADIRLRDITAFVPNVTTYTRTGLTASTTYYAWIRATNRGGKSAWSAVYSRSTPSGLPGPPIPTNFAAATVTNVSIRYTWTTVPTANYYEIYYATSATPPTRETVPNGGSSHNFAIFTQLHPNTTYYAWIRSVGATERSDWSSVVTTTTRATASVPAVPRNFVSTSQTNNRIAYVWNAVGNAERYDIYISTSATAPQDVPAIPSGAYSTRSGAISNYGRAGLAPNTTYYAWIRAVNRTGRSAWSSVVTVTTAAGGSAPAVPTGLRIRYITHPSPIRFTWNAVTGATGYDVWFRSETEVVGDPTAFTVPKFSTGAVTQYDLVDVSDIDSGLGYDVFIRSKNANGVSAWSPSSYVDL